MNNPRQYRRTTRGPLPIQSLGLLLLLLLCFGCSTKNVGLSELPDFNGDDPQPLSVSATAPTGLIGNAPADWTVSWSGGTAPFSVSWTFGDGADPSSVELSSAQSPSTGTVVMQNDTAAAASFSFSVSVSDAAGQTDSVTGSYSVAPAPAPEPENFRLFLFHNNDGESQLVDAGTAELPDGNNLASFGGAAYFVTKVEELREDAADSLGEDPGALITVSSGDNFLAGPEFNASLQDGTYYDAIALEAVGYDAICLGNHDFDFGPELLADFIGQFSQPVPYLSANLDFSQEAELAALDGNRLFASTVVEKGGRSIGIIGATTELLASISSPRNVGIGEVVPAVLAEVDALEAAGVNIIILISHLQDIDNELEIVGELRGIDVVVAGGGDELLANASGAENLIPGDEPQAGRSYPLLATDSTGAQVPVVTTPGEYRYVGRLVLDFDDAGRIASWAGNKAGSQVVDILSGLQRVANSVYPDAVAADSAVRTAAIEPVQESIEALSANVIGSSEVPLNGQRGTDTLAVLGVRNGETNLGNLDADALLWQANQLATEFGAPQAQIGLQNGGGIRNNSLIPAGPITELDTFSINAFANFVAILEGVTVEVLKETLETSVYNYPDSTGGFLQVSGMYFDFDPAAAPHDFDNPGQGKRIRNVWLADGTQLISDGEPLIPGQKVNIATIDFTARGGDGIPLAGDELHVLGASYQQALYNYIVDGLGGTIRAVDYPEGGERRIMSPLGELEVALTHIGGYNTGLGEASNEIVAFDDGSNRLFVINTDVATMHVVDASDPASLQFESEISFEADFGPNSVAVKNGIVAVALGNDSDVTAPGRLQLFDADSLSLLKEFTTGVLPDMVTFSPDGRFVLTADEGQPNDDYTADPLGGVTVVDLSAGIDTAAATVLDFSSFDAQRDSLIAAGVRIFGRKQPGNVLSEVSEDLEPEYITVSADNRTAWVGCQENNAIAVLDLTSLSFTDLFALGSKDWSGIKLDPSNDDGGIAPGSWPVRSFYMPDAISAYCVGGEFYIASANEGDAREYSGFSEDSRVKDYTLDALAFPDLSFGDDDKLGRLKVSLPFVDPDGDGTISEIFGYGGRSFSIWSAASQSLVFDSADSFEEITAAEVPLVYNSDGTAAEFDQRSDDKGPEPEGITVGFHRGRWFAFTCLERTGGLFVHDVTNPLAPEFVQFIHTNPQGLEDGDLGPEGVVFVPAYRSPSGRPLVFMGNEISGTTSVFQLDENTP